MKAELFAEMWEFHSTFHLW